VRKHFSHLVNVLLRLWYEIGRGFNVSDFVGFCEDIVLCAAFLEGSFFSPSEIRCFFVLTVHGTVAPDARVGFDREVDLTAGPAGAELWTVIEGFRRVHFRVLTFLLVTAFLPVVFMALAWLEKWAKFGYQINRTGSLALISN
jgi:hypothetical protein